MRSPRATLDLRDTILDATERLIARFGYKKMTMDDLASEAGIGKGTTYLHFPSKEEVVLCTIDRIVDRLVKQLREIAASDAEPTEKIRQMLVKRVLFRFDSIKEYSQGLDELLRALRPAYLLRRERYLAAEAEVFSDVLIEGRNTGTFTDFDPAAIAKTLLVATNSLLPFSLSRQELGSRRKVEDEVTRIADLLLKGMLQRE